MNGSARTLLLISIFVLAVFTASAQSQTSDFTVVVVPDTDIAAQLYPQTIQSQMQWIANNAAALNIQMVLGVGDNVEDTTTTEFQRVDTAVQLLDSAGIPYLLAIGNHDYANNDPTARTAGAALFNQFFGPTRYSGYTWYGGQFPSGSNENFYGTLTINGKEVLFLVLELYPRESAVAWARSVIEAHANDEVIIVTHAFTHSDNRRAGGCASGGPNTYSLTNVHDPEELWDNFIKQYPNVSLVVSGHFVKGDSTGESVGRRVDPGINGNLVNQVLANYEALGSGGNGYLRLMKFRPSLNTIEVTTYSPTLNAYLTDTKNQFTLTWHGTAPSSGGSITFAGALYDASCNVVPGATVSVGAASTVTSSSGTFSMSVPTPQSTTLTVATSAGSVSRSETLATGYSAYAKLQLTNGDGAISGTVTGGGSPAAGAIVSYIGGSTLADSNGNYQLQTVVAGTYDVTAVAPGGAPVTQSVNVPSGGTAVANFTLSQATTGSITGTVKNSSGSAIAGATVSYSGGSATTNASGVYTLSSVGAGSYSVTASASGYLNASQNVTVTTGSAATANFTLAKATVTVTYPTATGVNWGIGSTQQIKWSQNVGSSQRMKIELSRDLGATWELLAASVPNSSSTSGSYNWTVTGPVTAGATALIRVSWTGGTASDVSNNPFTIANPFITVTAPTSSSKWGYGTSQKIAWKSNLGPLENVNVLFSADAGVTFSTLSSGLKATTGSIITTTPTLTAATTTAVVQVQWAGNTIVFGNSPNFAVAPPYITVSKPNGGETWTIGNSASISSSNNLGSLESVTIQLSTDGGATYPITLFSSVAATGTKSVTVQSGWASTTARVRITWLKNSAVTDASNGNFTIN